MPSIEEVLGRIKVPVRSVTICLDADLQAEHDRLTEQLDLMRRQMLTGGKMGDSAGAREVAQQVAQLEDDMRASEVTFKFRGLSKAALGKLMERFPPPEDKKDRLSWDVEKGAHVLLALSAVEPSMSEAQAEQLMDTVTEGQAERLVGCAWLACTGSTQVPFSARASELIRGSGSS